MISKFSVDGDHFSCKTLEQMLIWSRLPTLKRNLCSASIDLNNAFVCLIFGVTICDSHQP